MANKAQSIRRWIGGVFLGLSILTLILGESVLKDPLARMFCWALCFTFTCLAILVAFWDLYAVRRHAREEQRALLEDTLTEIERRNAGKSKGSSPD